MEIFHYCIWLIIAGMKESYGFVYFKINLKLKIFILAFQINHNYAMYNFNRSTTSSVC